MTIPEIDVSELARLRAEGAPLVDVREADEYDEFHVPGARLIPLATVPEQLEEFSADERVYVICKGGGRSAKAVEFLNANGFDAVNVAGGSTAWRDAGHPVVIGSEPG